MMNEALRNYAAGNVTGVMLVAQICEHFGWTYWEYMDQPSWFLTLVQEKMEIDGQERKAKEQKAEVEAQKARGMK